MLTWFWIILLLLVLAVGAALQARRLAGRGGPRERKSLRARRAELWRRRREDASQSEPGQHDER